MATTYKPWETSTEYGTRYRFDKAGDGIPMHSHITNPAMCHSTRCVAGSVEIYGDVPTQVLHAGESAVFKSYRMHEIVALQDNTEIINVFDSGKPKDYENVPPDVLSGTLGSALTGKNSFRSASRG
jgi:quercetin dioxygenase-like cupin family protein